MNSNRSLPLLFLLILTFGSVTAQIEIADTLKEQFNNYRLNHPQEKLYLHCDRSTYLTGEMMWFKIYCTDGALHEPMDLSKVTYVELLDESNISQINGKISMDNGKGNGSFYLPASLKTGNYTLRAYTRWMRNNSVEFFFHKTVAIINPFVSMDPPVEKKGSSFQISLFPEGGVMINGIKTKIAFSVKDGEGKGVACSVALVDERNDTLISARPARFGLGYFYYTPNPDSHPRVVVIDPDKKVSTANLPAAIEKGFSVHLSDSTAQYLRLEVRSSPSQDSSSIVCLFVHARQIIAHSEARSMKKNTTVFNIDKSKLSEGISHLTLFDKNLKPVCERLYFKQPKRKLDLTITSGKHEYGTKRKIDLALTSLISNSPTDANLSVAVYKSDSLNVTSHNGIYEYLWLSSDLTGRIESPEYYFSDDAEVSASADLLMLTHGWRRFKWTDVLTDESFIKYLPEHQSHIVRGKVTDRNGVPAADIKTYLAAPNKVIRTYASVSNKAGLLKFELSDFWGPTKLVAQTNYSGLRVSLENPFNETYSILKNESVVLHRGLKNALLERSIFMQTQDIYFGSQRDRFQRPAIDSTAFYGTARETYYLDAYTRFPIMEEVMREYVTGVRVRKHGDNFVFVLVDNESQLTLHGTPLILLDGVPIPRTNDIMAFDPRKIKKLEVITKPFYLGTVTENGIVSYTTYAGDLGGFTIDPSAVMIDYEGLQLQREFHHPVYTDSNQQNNLPDFRNLLAWFPDVSTNDKGQCNLQFYTSSLEGDYVIAVEGLTKNGYSGGAVSTFIVKDRGK